MLYKISSQSHGDYWGPIHQRPCVSASTGDQGPVDIDYAAALSRAQEAVREARGAYAYDAPNRAAPATSVAAVAAAW